MILINLFKKFLHRIDNWKNEASGWVIVLINGEYVNISIYSPLSGSSYIELPVKLRNSIKGHSYIKSNDKCFLWHHIRHLNPLKMNPEGITKAYRNMVIYLDYECIEFPVSKKDYCKIEQKNNICINEFCYENNLVYPVHISDHKFKDCLDLLMITDENKSHYIYIRDFNRFMCNKTKSTFANIVYNVLIVKKSCKNVEKSENKW